MNIIIIISVLIVGGSIGYVARYFIASTKRAGIELEIKQMMISAKEEAQKILSEGQSRFEKKQNEIEFSEKQKKEEYKQTEKRLIKKEEFLDSRQVDIDKEKESVKKQEEKIKTIQEESEMLLIDGKKKLEEIARLTQEEAMEKLLVSVSKNNEEDLLIRMNKLDNSMEEKIQRRAQDILAMAIQRYAGTTASEFMTTNVSIPSDDVKGKVIGKEGRNIRAFEAASGVELIVDDTPGTIVISSFDPVRRQIARVALENLIVDGRIQPAKIEEFIKKAQDDINTIIKQKGEEAVLDCGIYNLDPRIVAIVGRLHFRTSYGQNVLAHSVEMAHIAGILAEEVGADVSIAKAGALVHDIGKALDHEVQGTHVDIGIRILQKFGADERIITAMKSHHDEYPYESVEAFIVQSADAISGARPGARRDSAENYIKRLQELEGIATSFKGVEKAYAISAGREIRVIVSPHVVSDIEAKTIARDIAKQIEADMKYPGEIKVLLIRENRITQYAR
ncbi:MAG: ribonuclease Y [Flavobacteriaceae bacterium]|jgi:ribonuclease Y